MFRAVIVLFVLFSPALNAQQNSLLWEVSGNGLTQSSYLFGTIHLQDKRVFCFPDSLANAMDSVKVVALEIVVNFDDPKALLDKIILKDEEKSLKKILTKQEYKKVKKAVAANCALSMTLMMDKVLPVLVAAELMSSQTHKDEKYPMDLYLQKRAEKKGKTLLSLESIESQFSVLDRIPIEKQKEELLAVVDSLEYYKILTDSMISLYQQQNVQALFTMSDDYNSAFDAAWQVDLLDNRNLAMAEKIIAQMPLANMLVAVGAAHLPGSKGLVKLLQQAGYTVRPLYSLCSNQEK